MRHVMIRIGTVFAAALLLGACGPVTGESGPVDAAGAASPSAPAPATTEPAAEVTAEPTEPPVAAPVVEKKTVKSTQRIAFSTKTVKDANLASGTKKVRTKGVNGTRTVTYEVTYTDGKETGRKVVGSTVTKAPVTEVVAVGTKKTESKKCDPNYSGCVPVASDVDCAGGGGNGPAYADGPVEVIGEDIYDLDADNDGYGCE